MGQCAFVVQSVGIDHTQNTSKVIFKHDTARAKVDVYIDDVFFTSYCYIDSLAKPILYPVYSPEGQRVTRAYPLQMVAGERADHPHHYGVWFNHGSVNGIDFWNNGKKPPKDNVRYGSIVHQRFLNDWNDQDGQLHVKKLWLSDVGEKVLTERSLLTFQQINNIFLVTQKTSLIVDSQDVVFEDSKEGMFAIRVRRELEMKSKKPVYYVKNDLTITSEKITDTTGVTGTYQNSEGVSGYPEVWGKRARWMQLKGRVIADGAAAELSDNDEENLSIYIFDNPKNVNHPPHWMARDYGLFAVNPCGSKIYTEGKEELNLQIAKGDSVVFTHQILIKDGRPLANEEIESLYNRFTTKN